MSFFDRWNRRSPERTAPAPDRDDLGVERMAGDLAVTIIAVDDPFPSGVVNGHCSEEYKAGRERLVTVDVTLRNDSRTETVSVSGSKLHLFDDAHYLREPLVLDSRARRPAFAETLLPPGAAVRGWVTFCLPWDRQVARLQLFTGYLSAKVAVFHFRLRDGVELARRREDALRAGVEEDEAPAAAELHRGPR